MIEMGRCGRRVALLTGYVVVCGVWFGSSSPLRRKGGFSNKWMSRLEVVDERWDWAGSGCVGWICFVFQRPDAGAESAR